MKKTTIFLLFGILVSLGVATAQTHIDSTHATIHVIGGDSTIQEAHAKIINTGSSALTSIVVNRTSNVLANGDSSYFCWGIYCYGPATSLSPHPQAIAAGDTNGTFVAYITPYGSHHPGTSVVQYCFYDNTGTSDTLCFTITYDMISGINDLQANVVSVSGAYPNPANSLTSISYNLNSAKNAKLIFYNMLGSPVKEINLTEKQNTLIISTTDLKSGVYFYSLIADGKSMASKKLIVTHR